jgi:hypothetical protein
LFLPLAIACVLAAVALLVSRFREASTEVLRQQLKWVALGLVSGIALILGARAGGALSGASPRQFARPILWEAMFQLGIIAIALGFLVSLLRYRLFDAETAISRSAAFAVLTIAVVAVFAGTEATIENLGQVYFGMGLGNVSAAMAAAVAAVFLNPLHSRISNWAEQHFQRDLVGLKTELPELLADLSVSASFDQLGAAVLPRIGRAIHATRSALLVEGRVAVDGIDSRVGRSWALKWIDTVDRRVNEPSPGLFPLRLALRCTTGRTVGWLLLGPRPDGSLYGRDDLDALSQILPSLRRALTAIVAHEATRAESRQMRSELSLQLDRVQARVLALEA